MSVNPLWVQQVSTITRRNAHTHTHIITAQLNHWEHSCAVHQQFHFYRQSTRSFGQCSFHSYFPLKLHGMRSSSHMITMKPTSKPEKKRKEKGLINESQSLCISVWTWKCLVCVCKMIYTVEFSVPPQWVLNAEVVSHVCARPAANKQWGCIRFSQKVPVYKATVMSCWCRINATTPYLAVRLGVILSFMSHLSVNQGWQGFTSFMLISSETNKQKRII